MSDHDKPRILTVEDNRDTRTLLQYMLQPHFEVVYAAHVDEALETSAGEHFDLLLLDINLGEERTGIDLLRLLREQSSLQNTPAVALTAYAMPGDRERFLNAGFEGYVSKPFTREELIETMESAIESK